MTTGYAAPHHRRGRPARQWLLVLCFVALGCSVRYGPRIPGFQPGYEEERMGERTWHIQVGEAWPKDRPVIGKIALYRAAELAHKAGFGFFEILSSSESVTNYALYFPGTSTTRTSGYAVGSSFSATSYTTSTPGTVVPIQGNWAYLDVRFLDAREAAEKNGVIEVSRVIEDLKYMIARRR